MFISYVKSVRNSKNFEKPNEDYYLRDAQNNIYIIVDGVSRDKIGGVYPIPSPATEVSKLFVTDAYSYMNRYQHYYNDDIDTLLKNAMDTGNKSIYEYNKHNYNGDFLPGTVGIISIIKENIMYYAYIGDCFIMAVSDKDCRVFTEPQTKKIHEHIKLYSAHEVRNDICNNKQHPYSYGVLNGCPKANDFVVTGSFDIRTYKRIFLYTDGLEKYMQSKKINDLLSMEINDIINDSYNSSDDDKTLLMIKI